MRLPLAICLGILLLQAVVSALNTPMWEHTGVVLAMWIVAGLAWCWAIRLARGGEVSLRVVVAGAVLLRLITLMSWPDLSDDIYRYVWEGELVARGISPYWLAPDAPQLAHVAAALQETHGAVNHPSISAVYPPMTQAAFALVVLAERVFDCGAVLAMRTFFALCDLLVIVPLVALLRGLGKPVGLAVVWAWSPLLVMEFAGSGHFDSLGVLLLLSSLALFSSSSPARRLCAHGWLAAAIVVKYIPLAALPFVVRDRRPLRRAACVLFLAAASFVPLLLMEGGLQGLFSGLGEYGLRWQSTGLVHPHVSRLFEGWFEADGGLLDGRRLVRLTLGAVWLATALVVLRRRLDPVRSTGILVAAFLILTPTLHPWYLAWLVPFVALRPSAAWIWLMVTIPLNYITLRDWKMDGVWQESAAVQALIAIPFFVLLAVEVRRFWLPSEVA